MNTIQKATRRQPLTRFAAFLAALFASVAAPAALFPLAGDQNIRMVVAGDSLTWGQGLRQPDKMHSLVEGMLRGCNERLTVTTTVLAHSGATIGVGVPFGVPGCQGEVPLDQPTILQQVRQFTDDPSSVDVVLMDGGINDIRLETILSPLVEPAEISRMVKTNCFHGMTNLLETVVNTFPNARIVVCGYYQMVSEDSDITLLQGLMVAGGVIVGSVGGGISFGVWASVPGAGIGAGTAAILSIETKARIVENCRTFSVQSRQQLQAAIAAVNERRGGTRRICFVHPGFETDEAIFAPRSKLFGINAVSVSWPLLLTPADPVADWRRMKCDDCDSASRDLLQRNICYYASMGHPNEAGARNYAHSIYSALTTENRGVVWADFSAPCSTFSCGTGHFENPWGSLNFALLTVPEGGTIRIKPSSEPGAFTLTKPCLLEGCGGSATIGR